ncbi:tetratricopeptide repeat protein [Nonomuraea sp. K274]|uniref:Tetratricopeptide repeat protein n=1 Tax=Nonomuraea cypriaca TaxID=1187855 RepID=A0A931AT79_9ACTN|nr:tetratricopeptide repeat protein [Nonomuraea cypriaca]MBF8194537.1 tetratricopeptide repeat protein [Nonomuraea cypriaca]
MRGVDGRADRTAQGLYDQAVFGGDADGLDAAERELNAVEADLALVRGRVLHARFLSGLGGEGADPEEWVLFERAAELYRSLGDVRGEGEALFWVGAFHQVVRKDENAAAPLFERAHEHASQAGDKLTLSYVLRPLGIAEHLAGRLAGARERLEESVRLRREIGFPAGVAANLVGLAHVAVDDGRRDDAAALLDEAGTLAETAGAKGVTRWVEEVRKRL